MTTTDIGPVDDRGRLLHEDDLVAQLALAVRRLEECLAGHGRGLAEVATLRVRLAAPVPGAPVDEADAELVAEVLAERLADLGATPRVTVVRVQRLALPGMRVTLDADLT